MFATLKASGVDQAARRSKAAAEMQRSRSSTSSAAWRGRHAIYIVNAAQDAFRKLLRRSLQNQSRNGGIRASVDARRSECAGGVSPSGR